MRDDNLFTGTSTFGVGINNHYILEGSAYNGINLNSYSRSVMRYSYYGEIEGGASSDPTDTTNYNIFIGPNKAAFTRFGFKTAYVLYATSPEDEFLPDTRNPPFLTKSEISEPTTFTMAGLLSLCLVCLKRRNRKFSDIG